MTRSRTHAFLLATALVVAVGLAFWQTRLACAASEARDTAERELHASESLLQTAKHDAAAADQRMAAMKAAIARRTSAPALRPASARPLSGSALVRQQTADSLRGRPEVLAAAREAAMRRIRWQYGPFFARLGLNPDQAAEVEGLLVQREGIKVDNYELQPVDSDARRTADAELQQALGDSGYTQLTAYTNTLPVRADVARLAGQLSQVEPLSAEVAEKLVQAGAAAVARKQEAAAAAGITGYGFFTDELMLPAARSLLTPRQLQVLTLMVEEETGRKVGGS